MALSYLHTGCAAGSLVFRRDHENTTSDKAKNRGNGDTLQKGQQTTSMYQQQQHFR